jgi:DNA-binding NarL/FixJ family response regulator
VDEALPAANERGVADLTDALDPGRRLDRVPVRVFVVDDDHRFRTALAELLIAHGLEVVGTAGRGETLLEKIRSGESPDVVLLDLQMPVMDGLQTLAQLQAVAPTVKVLMLTVSGAEDDVLDAILGGASGYLVKGTPPETLIAGIHGAATGNSLLSAGLAVKLLGRIRSTPRGNPSPLATVLSERELEVLELLARGKQNSEIARALYLSPHTVRNHISNILAKLRISNRSEATAYAIRAGLVS